MKSGDMIKKLGRLAESKTREVGNGTELKDHILRHLRDGKSKLTLLEKRITRDPKVQDLLERARSSKIKLEKARGLFNKYEKMAEKYVERNPKKAVAMAVAAGVLAGNLWSAFKTKKTSPPKRSPASRTKRIPLKP